MSYSICEIVVNAARQKILVQAHIPVYYQNLYITREMGKRSPNTQQTFLSHVIALLEFLWQCGSNSLDITQAAHPQDSTSACFNISSTASGA